MFMTCNSCHVRVRRFGRSLITNYFSLSPMTSFNVYDSVMKGIARFAGVLHLAKALSFWKEKIGN